MFPSNSTTYIFQQVAVSLFHCLTMAAFLSSVYRRRYIFMTYISHIVACYMSILCYMLKDFFTHPSYSYHFSVHILHHRQEDTANCRCASHTHTHTHYTHTTHTTHTRYLCRFSDKLVCIISGWCTLIQN